MQNQKNEDLSKRAAACPKWRWTSGMLACRTTHRNEVVQVRFVDGLDIYAELADPRVIERMPSKTLLAASGHTVIDGWHRVDELFPDLSDPATLGCLLALVREVWNDIEAHLALGGSGWVLLSGESRVATVVYPTKPGQTEAEALVNALEAAP